eukprot:PhM_4_TR3161/c0_g1_i1/m.62724
MVLFVALEEGLVRAQDQRETVGAEEMLRDVLSEHDARTALAGPDTGKVPRVCPQQVLEDEVLRGLVLLWHRHRTYPIDRVDELERHALQPRQTPVHDKHLAGHARTKGQRVERALHQVIHGAVVLRDHLHVEAVVLIHVVHLVVATVDEDPRWTRHHHRIDNEQDLDAVGAAVDKVTVEDVIRAFIDVRHAVLFNDVHQVMHLPMEVPDYDDAASHGPAAIVRAGFGRHNMLHVAKAHEVRECLIADTPRRGIWQTATRLQVWDQITHNVHRHRLHVRGGEVVPVGDVVVCALCHEVRTLLRRRVRGSLPGRWLFGFLAHDEVLTRQLHLFQDHTEQGVAASYPHAAEAEQVLDLSRGDVPLVLVQVSGAPGKEGGHVREVDVRLPLCAVRRLGAVLEESGDHSAVAVLAPSGMTLLAML